MHSEIRVEIEKKTTFIIEMNIGKEAVFEMC